MTRAFDRLTLDRARARLAGALSAYAYGVDENELQAETRGTSAAALARQVAMYLAHVSFEMSISRVGVAFGRDRSTVAYACRQIEDRRDDPAFDAMLCAFEDALRATPLPLSVS